MPLGKRVILGVALALLASTVAACTDDPLRDDSKTAIGSQKKCIGFGHVPNITPYYSPCYSPYPPKP